MRDVDAAAIPLHLSQLESLINRGMADALRWAEVYKVTEQIGRTKEREYKRLVTTEKTMTVDQELALIGQIEHIVKDNVTNRDEIAAVHRAIARFGVVETGRADSGTGH